jgi:hypothetical protein
MKSQPAFVDALSWASKRCPIGRWDNPPQAPFALADITLVVTSFLRFDCLRRLLSSVRHYYPGLAMIVADQSGEMATGDDSEYCRRFPGVTWLALPYDCGLSAARNAAVRAGRSPLVFLCDDDEIFTPDTRLEALLDVLNSDRSVQLASGLIRQHGKEHGGRIAGGWSADLTFDEATGTLHAAPPARPWQATASGTWYRRVDRFVNVFLARRELLMAHPWNERHKISGEHLDHCLRLQRAGAVAAYTPQCIIGERKSNSPKYEQLRKRGRGKQSHADLGVKNKTGLWAFAAEAGVGALARPADAPRPEPPCIVLLTVGHTGSTVVAGLFGALGWHLPDNDPEYNEPRAIREANRAFLRGEKVDCQRIITDLPRPWLIKDPRFSQTLERWLPAFAEFKPMLVWLERNEAAVRASWQRRGEPLDLLGKRQKAAETAFEYWPWAKRKIDFEAVGRWVSSYKCDSAELRLR